MGYPDDMRNHDSCTQSPYYDDSREIAELNARDVLVDEWRRERMKTGKVDWFGGDPMDEAFEGETLGAVLDRFALLEVQSWPEFFRPTIVPLDWG